MVSTRWNTVAILGVGLLGGSLGLALRRRGLAKEVVGWGREAGRLQAARRKGAVTRTSTRLERAVADADVVVACVPVQFVAPCLARASQFTRSGALLTDVGSTKEQLVKTIESEIPRETLFVGSHPIAGSDKSGVHHADPDLFSGRLVVVTPSRRTPQKAVRKAEQLWHAVGAYTERLTPGAHDRVLAATSHLPHLVASALAGATERSDLPFTGGGWADTTRVAAGSPEVWLPILAQNRTPVLKSLLRFEKSLAAFRRALETNDARRLHELLASGKDRRDALGS